MCSLLTTYNVELLTVAYEIMHVTGLALLCFLKEDLRGSRLEKNASLFHIPPKGQLLGLL